MEVPLKQRLLGLRKLYIFQFTVVLYEPASVEELGLRIALSPDVLFNIFHWSLSILQYLARQQLPIICASGHAACWPYPCHFMRDGCPWSLVKFLCTIGHIALDTE